MIANVLTGIHALWICLAPEDNTIASIISSITNYGFGAEKQEAHKSKWMQATEHDTTLVTQLIH